MKRWVITVMAVSLFGILPAFAAADSLSEKEREDGLRQCAFQAESIQEKIQRLQNEIKMGAKRYSAEELQKLQNRLKEANRILEELTRN